MKREQSHRKRCMSMDVLFFDIFYTILFCQLLPEKRPEDQPYQRTDKEHL